MSGISLEIPHLDGVPRRIDVQPSDLIFLIGANGTGKSSLLLRLKQQLGGVARLVVAHRAVWLETDEVQLTASNRNQVENNLTGQEANEQSRTRDLTTGSRNQVMLYDLAHLENRQAQSALAAIKDDDIDLAKRIAAKTSAIGLITSILQASGLPIEIALSGGSLVARKQGYPEYGVSKLSDGERNAVLIAAYAVTMPKGCVLLLDEPERHLHQSIAAPLIANVLALRPDCSFIVLTHELALAIENSTSRVIQIQSYSHQAQQWDFDELSPNTPVRESIASAILGMRRRILVVEGEASSLDLQLYSILFPSISVFSKGTSSSVKNVVDGINNSQESHRSVAIGIVDGDAMLETDRKGLISRNIFPLVQYSIEYLYYCRSVFEWVICNHARIHGIDPSAAMASYKSLTVAAMVRDRERMVAMLCVQKVRSLAMTGLPTWQTIANETEWTKTIDLRAEFLHEGQMLDAAIEAQDTEYFLRRFPFRQSDLRNALAQACGLSDRFKYEHSVRTLALQSTEFSGLLVGLLGEVAEKLA